MTISEFRGEHAYLSNGYIRPLKIGDYIYSSAEQYYQSRKCLYIEDWDDIMACRTPAQARAAGALVTTKKGWRAHRLEAMRRTLFVKFTLDSDLGERLISTGSHLLINGSVPEDDFWGMHDGFGRNWLGHLLMARRGELRGTKIYHVTGPVVQA